MDALGACLTSHITALRALAATKQQEQEIKRALINVCSQCADVCWKNKYFYLKKIINFRNSIFKFFDIHIINILKIYNYKINRT